MRLNEVAGSTSEPLGITDGQTITLKFDATVDGEQTPLNRIYVDWGDQSAPIDQLWEAKATTHIFSHEYSCDIDNDLRTDGAADGICKFKPRITIVDNWNWCSGKITTGVGDHRYDPNDGQTLQTSCGSYDEPNLTIVVNAKN